MHNYFPPSHISITIFYDIVQLAVKSAPTKNAEPWAGLTNRTQNGKWQATEHKVQVLKCWVSLSWPGNLCRVILIPWEARNPGQDLKSALYHDKPGRKCNTVHSWCLSPSKPHSSQTQTGIMCSGGFANVGDVSVHAQRRSCGCDQPCSWTSMRCTYSKTSPPHEPKHSK